MISDQAFAIFLREIGQALERAAVSIQPIPEAPAASADVVPIRQPAQPAASQPATPPQATPPATPATPAASSVFAGAPAAQWEGAQQNTQAVTLQDVANAFRQLQQTQGPGPIVDKGGILEQFGIARVSEARPEQYPALIAAAQQRMGQPAGAA